MNSACVYVIHFALPEGQRAHYVGYCSRRNWKQRLYEHRSRPETPLLATYFERATFVEMNPVHWNAQKHDERFIADEIDAFGPEIWCPVCKHLAKSNEPMKKPD